MKRLRILAGLLVWLAIGSVLAFVIARDLNATEAGSRSVLGQLWGYWSQTPQPVELRFSQATEVALGDPVFVRDSSDGLRQVGEVRQLLAYGQPVALRRAKVAAAQVIIFDPQTAVTTGASIRYVRNPESMSWVIETLLTPERKAAIAAEMSRAMEEHQDEIIAALRPVFDESLAEGAKIVKADLPAAIARRQPQFNALGAKYQKEIVEEDLVPLVKAEIWPLVRARAEPTMKNVGREIWQKVSVWRFGWRAIYDEFPLTRDKLVEKEFQRFMDKEASPILARHSEDFEAIVRDSLRDAAKNERVRETVRDSLAEVAADPEFQALAREITQEVVFDNPELREALARTWAGPEAKRALRIASQRLEPSVRRIADLVLGTREEGITPEFAKVLRNQILAKDRRWFLLDLSTASGEAPSEPLVLQVQVPKSSSKPTAAIRPSESRP